MKNWKLWSGCGLLVAVALYASCKEAAEPITIVDVMHEASVMGPGDEMSIGIFDYDSVQFSDGSYAVGRHQHAPQNALFQFFDAAGRLQATRSYASEVAEQVLVYGYDHEGRLSHLMSFSGPEYDYMYFVASDSGYLAFRKQLDSIDFDHPDTTICRVAHISYDVAGRPCRVTEVPTGRTIQAPAGYGLDIRVEPGRLFWMSDLNGGYFYLNVDVVPAAGQQNYRVSKFVDFVLSSVEYYVGGQRRRVVEYDEASSGRDGR